MGDKGFKSVHSGVGTPMTYTSIRVDDRGGAVRVVLIQPNTQYRTIEMTREQANALGRLLMGEDCSSWHTVGTVR